MFSLSRVYKTYRNVGHTLFYSVTLYLSDYRVILVKLTSYILTGNYFIFAIYFAFTVLINNYMTNVTDTVK